MHNDKDDIDNGVGVLMMIAMMMKMMMKMMVMVMMPCLIIEH